jgi:hypothetical protein
VGQLQVAQLVKKFPAFNGTQRFIITLFTPTPSLRFKNNQNFILFLFIGFEVGHAKTKELHYIKLIEIYFTQRGMK